MEITEPTTRDHDCRGTGLGAWLRRRWGGRRPAHPSPGAGAGRERSRPNAASPVRALAQQLVGQDRYALVLIDEAAGDVDAPAAELAWAALEQQMALVPGGAVAPVQPDGSTLQMEIAAFYLDRCAVTNAQYLRFVQSGCYDELEIWPREIWPGLMRFVDATGQPGPLEWRNGQFAAGLADHPVVGICWYEAATYARWVGKRLPTAAEWQKAAGWPEHLSGGRCNRFPWGDLYAADRANLGVAGRGRTEPVRSCRAGATPNGIYQLAGNVWEWLDDPLEAIPCQPNECLRTTQPIRRIVGGAFDTYFVHEAANQFITGQAALDRRANIGFRCAVEVGRLRPRRPAATRLCT